jgi:LPXTG-motif cell wall-anchored protein
MRPLLQYLLGFVCFLVGAVFCIDAINSRDPWSMGIGLMLFTAAFLLVRRKRHQYFPLSDFNDNSL